jgi:hypothetical protein
MSYFHIVKSQQSWRDVGKYNTESTPRIAVRPAIISWLRANPARTFSVYEIAQHITHRSMTAVRTCLLRLADEGILKSLRNDMFENTGKSA